MFSYVSTGAALAFAAAVQPGPLLTYLVSQTLVKGWRRTLPAALSPLVSDVPIVLLVLLVLTSIPPSLQRILQMAGGVYLLYLAWGAAKTWRKGGRVQVSADTDAIHRSVLKAATVNLLNPNPYLGWSLVMGPMLLQAWHENPYSGILLLVAFYGTIVLTLAATIIVFGVARTLGPKINRWMIAASALGLAAFGCIQLWLGLKPLFFT